MYVPLAIWCIVNKLVFVGDIAVKICLKSTSGSVPNITATMTHVGMWEVSGSCTTAWFNMHFQMKRGRESSRGEWKQHEVKQSNMQTSV